MNEQELRELDAEVAEKVFGRRRYRYGKGSRSHLVSPEKTAGNRLYELVIGELPLADEQIEPIPRYSTDIAAAWLVVEKLMPRIGHIYPAFDVEPSRFMHWVAVLEHPIWENRRGFTEATAPLAICRAALAAMKGA